MSSIENGVTSLLRILHPKPKPELNVLVLGLNNAGKSTLVGRLSSENEESVQNITPTVEPNKKHIKLKNIKLCLWDLGGQWRMRQSWHTYYLNTHALIYVIDSTDVPRLGESRCELCDVLLDERMANVPLLILANKQDARGALSRSMLTDLLGLQRLEGISWEIRECSAKKGDGIDVIFDWIYKKFKKLQPSGFLSKIKIPVNLFGPACALKF